MSPTKNKPSDLIEPDADLDRPDPFASLKHFLERPFLKFRFSGLKIALGVYILTFGFYGYGSALDLEQPETAVPAVVGLITCLTFAFWGKSNWTYWEGFVTIRLKHLLFFLFALASTAIFSASAIGSELVGDELAYVNLSTAHASKLLELSNLGFGNWSAGSAIQVTQWLFIGVIFALLLALARLGPRQAIAFAGLSVAVAQCGFFLVGGWGWGYAEISWIPFLMTTAVFGVSSATFSLTSLALVSVGIATLYFSLSRFGMPAAFRFAVAFVSIATPVAFQYFSSLDHVVYFALFGLAAVSFVIGRVSERQAHLALLFIGLGVAFRLTVLFVLLAVLINALSSKLDFNKRLIIRFIQNPALIVLLPYGAGIALFPPVFSGRASTEAIQGAQEFLSALPAVSEQGGPLLVPLLALALLVGLMTRQNLIPSSALIIVMGFFYFGALNAAGLAGTLKYSAEWTPVSLSLASVVLWIGVNHLVKPSIANGKESGLFRMQSAALAALLASGWFVSTWGDLDSTKLKAYDAYAPQGYQTALRFVKSLGRPCGPVGVVYGNANEVLGGFSLRDSLMAKSAFQEVQSAQSQMLGSWTQLSESAAKGISVDCLYGNIDAFSGFEASSWEGWDVAFANSIAGDLRVIVLTKPRP